MNRASGGSRTRAAPPRLAKALLEAWHESVPREEWRAFDQQRLRRACAAQLRFGLRRRRRQTLLRILEAPPEESRYSVIDLVSEDMPFLVDTLAMTLAQAGVSVQLIIHPILRVRRDSSGRVLTLEVERPRAGEGPAGESPGLRESWQHLRVDRLGGERDAATLRRKLRSALADVRLACSDWPRMRQSALELAEDITRHPPPLAAEVISESSALLQYMEDHHFTFLGFREARLRRGRGGPTLTPLPESALGLMRHSQRHAQERGIGSANIRRAVRSPELLIITKANSRSTVHRPGYLDYVGVKRFDQRGRVSGEARFVGLWTSSAYNADPRQVPWLRLKFKHVMAHFPFPPASHDAKRLAHILETLPRDELLQASVADLIRCARAVLVLQGRARLRLILRRDEFQRFWSCLVFLPRERCDTAAQERIEHSLLAALKGTSLDAHLSIGDDPLAQLHVVVRVDPASNPRFDAARLERELNDALVSWRDRLRSALAARYDALAAVALERRYAPAFPDSYRQDVDAALAVEDIGDLERLEGAPEAMQLRLYRPAQQRPERVHLRILRRGEAISISDVLPTFEHFGLIVIAERPYRLDFSDGATIWVQDFELEHYARRRVPVGRVAGELIAAFRAVRAGAVDDDGFNRLLISAELTARQVTVLRACCRYLLQTGIAFSQVYMERVLAAHPSAARDLCGLFEQRLDPHAGRGSSATAKRLEQRLRREIGAVTSADEDRILRAFLAVVLAALRTNYFHRDESGQPRAWLSIKLDPERIPGLPLPRPAFELFVHSPRVEGVHLRKGPIARGGIRWSDRPEDFRTEILGLMKAQHVKNTLIVPVGAKGGFVARRLVLGAAREAQQREVIECYRSFIRGLLDVTDNIVEGVVVAPRAVRRLDRDDPYLVVAADKGTATFSDLANAISADYHFWLGDAFASGGSAGYDHKKMGITARGAWECVKRHFRELGRDIQREPFTVAGIGDMSGDVFGNAMLLSPQIRLVAAFNHQHIFIDPSPDPVSSRRERARLFRLPRSGWNDYDTRLLSSGGAVYDRGAKSLRLASEAQRLLGLPSPQASPVEVIRAILTMRVDLLWNGGIGTYVKASSERHGEVGDRANDALRVDGRQLRALVVGEGGNLGLTARGRVEYALTGGRLNADFIDNSAGVNTSDVEVNLKILLDAPEGEPVTRARRNRLLAAATDEVAALVVRNNYLQSQAISLLEQRAVAELSEHQQLLRWLERYGELDRVVEGLPGDEELAERRRQGRGLTRPELALLLAYGKIALNHALTESGSAADPYLATELQRYFPAALQRRFPKRIAHHRLRSQIITTALTNSIVNRLGPALLMECSEHSNASAAEVARAYTVARDSAELRSLWAQLEALDGHIPATAQYQALLTSNRYLRRLTFWLLEHRRSYTDVGAAVARLQPALREFALVTPQALEGLDRSSYLEERSRYAEQGLDDALAERLAVLEPLRVAPDLVELMNASHASARAVAHTHFALGARLGLDWLHLAIEQLPAENGWQSAARARLQAEVLGAHRRISAAVLLHRAAAGTRADAAAGALLERWLLLLRDLRALPSSDLAALTVAVEALEHLSNERAAALAALLH
jgi:glutamate dehydrogenase